MASGADFQTMYCNSSTFLVFYACFLTCGVITTVFSGSYCFLGCERLVFEAFGFAQGNFVGFLHFAMQRIAAAEMTTHLF